MGLYPQPNDWTCGPFALKHGLAALGRIADENAIRRHARTHWWSGTDEVRLARAARAFDCDLPAVFARRPELARKRLIERLRGGQPVRFSVAYHDRDTDGKTAKLHWSVDTATKPGTILFGHLTLAQEHHEPTP